MKLYITIAEEGKYDRTKKRMLVKEVAWVVPPPEGVIIFVGVGEDGGRADINAKVERVHWHSDGTITVEAVLQYCREEYDTLLGYLYNDGFAE